MARQRMSREKDVVAWLGHAKAPSPSSSVREFVAGASGFAARAVHDAVEAS